MRGGGIIKIVKKIFPIVASVSILIVALSFAYYLVVFLPSKEKARQEIETQKLLQEEREEQETVEKRKECLKAAYDSMESSWNESCKKRGLEERCSLPSSIGESFKERLSEMENRCFELYSSD